MAKKGIDVSKHNGKIDWAKVKASGVQFAMLRAGFGRYDNQKDERFEEYYAGATAAGIPVGAYHYSYATNAEQAKQEAETFLGWIKGKKFEYPVAYDIEDAKQSSLGKEIISYIIRAFCDTVEAAGYYVAVYANKSWLETKIDANCKSKYDTWLAQWTENPTYKGSYGMWQYTSDGKVEGITGRVDMDTAYTDYPSIIKEAGLNGCKSETQKSEVPTVPKLPKGSSVKHGDLVKVTGSNYYTGVNIPKWVKAINWYVKDVCGDRVVIDKSETGTYSINSPVNVKDVTVVKTSEKSPESNFKVFSSGDKVKLKSGVKTFSDGSKMANWVSSSTLYVRKVEDNGKILLVSTEPKKEVYTGRVNAADVNKV